MKVIRLADISPTPWANGGGETRVLWSDRPVGQRPGTFDRRISVATLVAPSPFSMMPGVSRSFMLLDEADVRLEMEERPVRPQQHEFLHFNGERRVEIKAIDRPCRALNVMSCGAWRHQVDIDLATGAWQAFVLLEDEQEASSPLRRGDLVFEPVPSMQTLRCAAISFRPVASLDQIP